MEKNLAYVPVTSKNAVVQKVPAMSKDEAARNAERYKKAYEEAITGKKIKNMASCTCHNNSKIKVFGIYIFYGLQI